MLNFTYYTPTRIVFGAGSIARLDVLVPADARMVHYVGTFRFHGETYLRATRDAIRGLSAA